MTNYLLTYPILIPLFIFTSLFILMFIIFISIPPEQEEVPFIPYTQSGYAIMDEIACANNIGCVWGIDAAFCLPGYTGPICETITT